MHKTLAESFTSSVNEMNDSWYFIDKSITKLPVFMWVTNKYMIDLNNHPRILVNTKPTIDDASPLSITNSNALLYPISMYAKQIAKHMPIICHFIQYNRKYLLSLWNRTIDIESFLNSIK